MIKQRLRLLPMLGIFAIVMATSCATTNADEKSLYQRLGGYDAVAAVVDDFMVRMMGDAQLSPYFDHMSNDSKTRARQLTVDFMCKATGGPCAYTGRDMLTSHRGMGITEAEWTAAAEHLTATLDSFKVPKKEKGEVLTFVTSLKGDIVDKQ